MNFHQIYIIHTALTSIFTFIANAVLIYLIYAKTPSMMKSYSTIILQTCVADLFMAFVSAFILFEIDTSHERIYLRSTAPWIPQFGCYPCFAFWLFFTATFFVHWSTFIQALFRYFQIVRSQTMEAKKGWIIQCIIFLACAITSLPLFSFCGDENAAENYVLEEIKPWKDEESLDAFRSHEIWNIYLAIYLITILLITSFFYFVYAFCMTLVLAKMKKSSLMFSQQTLKMHKELNRKSFYQMIIPLFAFIIGWLNCGGVYYDVIENISFLLIGFMIMQYIQVFNPIITIFTIHCYRDVIFGWKKVTPKSHVNSVSNFHLKSSSVVASTAVRS